MPPNDVPRTPSAPVDESRTALVLRIAAYRALKPGWDSYKAVPPTSAEIDLALDLVLWLHDNVADLQVSPYLDGGIYFEFLSGGRRCSLILEDHDA